MGENNAQMKEIAVKYLENNVKHRSDLGSGNDKKLSALNLKDFMNCVKKLILIRAKKFLMR